MKQTVPHLKRILIVRTDRIGDIVITTPIFKALRQVYPHAHIAVLVSPAGFDLVKHNPYIDDVLVDDRDGIYQGVIGFLQLARLIRKNNFDAAFIYHTKKRTNLACYLAGVPLRIGYKNDKLGFLLNKPIEDKRHLGLQHEALNCLDILKAVGINVELCDPLVVVGKDDQEWVREWFKKNELEAGKIIVIHPSASDDTKCWPAKSFAHLIDSLSKRYMYKIVFMGDKRAGKIVQDIRSLTATYCIDSTGQLTVGQMAALLADSNLLISNDSGPVHVASGVGTPVISIFTRIDQGLNPGRWSPLGKLSFTLVNPPDQAIRLDEKNQIKSGRLDAIKVEEVLDTVENIFQKQYQTAFIW